MKRLVVLFLLAARLCNAQNSYEPVASLSTNVSLFAKHAQQPIRLNLDKYNQRVTDYYQARYAGFSTIAIIGAGFIVTSLAQSGYSYGTYKNGQYVIPPFWQQGPRVIQLSMGVTMTTIGIVGLIDTKNK